MTDTVGIELELAELSLEAVTDLARRAEAAGIDVVALAAGDAELDPWTTAIWILGQTTRIRVAVDGAASPFPAVAAKAVGSADELAPGRLVTSLDGVAVARVRSVADLDALLPKVQVARRARRRPGIAYDEIPASLVERAVEPGDSDHPSVSSTYLRGGSPGLVLRPRTTDEVSDAVRFARQHRDVPFGVRSGGHGISGRSTNVGGLVIDVGGLNDITVLDEDRRIVRIGPGARWKDVARALDSRGWALGSGDYGGVGVGGLATAGGIGLLGRNRGLTIDHLRAVELVLADGGQVRASAEENPDLFWAVRGAGANFGIATAFEFEVDEVEEVGWAQFAVAVPDLEEALVRFGEVATAAPRDTTVFLVTGRPRQGQSVLQFFGMVESDDPDVIVERLTPFAELGALVQQQVVLTRYADVMALAADVGPDGHHGFGEPASRSAFAPTMTRELAADTAGLLNSGLVHFYELRTMGGAIADVPSDETAFPHRAPDFQVTAMGADQDALNIAWDKLAPHYDGLYISFDTDLRPDRLRDAWPPTVLARLRELKHRYDPTNLFRDNFNIDPEEDHLHD